MTVLRLFVQRWRASPVSILPSITFYGTTFSPQSETTRWTGLWSRPSWPQQYRRYAFQKGNQLALLVGAGFLEYPFEMRARGAELNMRVPRGILQRHASGKRRSDVRFTHCKVEQAADLPGESHG